mmetsp:Transcript_7302/g.12327  ORF Transcript_7302/g.12327 Transcript_7302/m.12327 type:complete len:201 (-) Transcript_7302:2804-3406(-)
MARLSNSLMQLMFFCLISLVALTRVNLLSEETKALRTSWISKKPLMRMACMKPCRHKSASIMSSDSSSTTLNTARLADHVFSNMGLMVEMSLMSTNLLFLLSCLSMVAPRRRMPSRSLSKSCFLLVLVAASSFIRASSSSSRVKGSRSTVWKTPGRKASRSMSWVWLSFIPVVIFLKSAKVMRTFYAWGLWIEVCSMSVA